MGESNKFDPTNPDHITYEHPPLEITVLGGIRLEGLDRMRATLKIKYEQQAIRHNLDLYNNIQVEKLVRRVAERLEIGTSVVTIALAELTEELEDYRMAEIERQSQSQDKCKFLTPDETKEAQLYLSSPNLMQRTKEDIGKAGVIGEENNRLLMYLIFTSRKRENPLHVISLGSSGIGKTHLQEKVGALIPEEDKLEITSLSGNAFYYFGQQELRNKLILIEDLDGAEDVLYPLREIQSKKRISKTIVVKNTRGETKTITLKVEGPVCVAGCTTKESLYEDNANRSFLIYIDESKEQDQKIMAYQRKLSAGKIDVTEEHGIAELLKNTQRILQPVQIRNPFAESLHIPEEVLKPRRTNAHYLAFIEAVTFYHQYQREKQYDKETGEEYIETTLEDIEEANALMKEILLRKSDDLNGATRSYFEQLKIWLKEEDKNSFTNVSARQALRVNASNQKRYMITLQEWGLVRKIKGDRKNGFAYEVVSYEDQKLRTKKIQSVLDEIVINLKGQQDTEKKTKKPKRSSK
ncbi:hypothetical protein C900_02840 [Fulvivirga imtechensis AK7]|uniref:DNA primase n=1 Tax=Fulvivirga imtechensis AK7 TaxID=1237149 RepID=L8JUU4_9BACT|nr:hypothetical protein [Fulvivirga imtechensis]ELR71339.1 hypothetical protein C900_02840 [Fulvivirga imtechensis AK7]